MSGFVEVVSRQSSDGSWPPRSRQAAKVMLPKVTEEGLMITAVVGKERGYVIETLISAEMMEWALKRWTRDFWQDPIGQQSVVIE